MRVSVSLSLQLTEGERREKGVRVWGGGSGVQVGGRGGKASRRGGMGWGAAHSLTVGTPAPHLRPRPLALLMLPACVYCAVSLTWSSGPALSSRSPVNTEPRRDTNYCCSLRLVK